MERRPSKKKLTEAEEASLRPRWELADFMIDELGEAVPPLSFFLHPHFGIFADTGRGKTYLLEQALTSLLRRSPWSRVVLLDPKAGKDLPPYLVQSGVVEM